ncbi:MAG: hypothetical protein JRI23_05950 [Deltaproteobacteria bacterium]|nr:hypothetical protein [Deltaproteobacteria bacterium]MBW2531106.1 hypothetical protein [Deltaproteobacteria bacterium]
MHGKVPAHVCSEVTRRQLLGGLAGEAALAALALGGAGCQPQPPSSLPSGAAPSPTSTTSSPTAAPEAAAAPFPTIQVAGTHRQIGAAVGAQFRDRIEDAVQGQPAFEACLDQARGPLADRVAQLEAATRQAYPHLVEELEGMAEGCGLPFADLFAWNCRSELDAAADPCPPGCSTAGWADPSRMLLAHNEDGPEPYDGRMFVLRARPPSGIWFAALVYPGTWPGNGPGLNDRGVVQSTNYISPCAAAAGIPRYALGRAVLEAPSLEEAIAVATRSGRAFPWHHNLASLTERKLVSLETWPGRHHRLNVAGLHLHTNHLVHPQMLDLPERKGYLARSSEPRLAALQRRLKGQQTVTRATLEAALQDRSGTPCKVCRRPGDEVPGVTVAMALFEAPERRMMLRGGQRCDGPWQIIEPQPG